MLIGWVLSRSWGWEWGDLCIMQGFFLMLRSGLASCMHTIYARKKRRVSATEGSEILRVTGGVGPEMTKARGEDSTVSRAGGAAYSP